MYDFEKKTLMRHGEPAELTALECRLLEFFLNNRGIVLSRETPVSYTHLTLPTKLEV